MVLKPDKITGMRMNGAVRRDGINPSHYESQILPLQYPRHCDSVLTGRTHSTGTPARFARLRKGRNEDGSEDAR